MTNREATARTVAEAVEYLTDVLADGPMPCREVKAGAERALGFRVDDREWQSARERVGAVSEKVGRTWWWSLPSQSFDAELAAWLSTPDGRFARYLAERDRLGQVREDEDGQLGLLVNGDAS